MQGIYRETFQWRKYYLTTSTLPPFSPLNQRLSTTPATKQGKGKGKGKGKSKAIQQKTTLLPDSTPTNQPSKPTNHEETPNRQNQTQTQTLSFHHSSFIIKKSHHNNANHPHQTLATRFPQPTPLCLRRSFLSLIEDFGRVSIATKTRTRTTTTTTTIRTARAIRATTTGRENLM